MGVVTKLASLKDNWSMTKVMPMGGNVANHENDKRCASSNYRVLNQRLFVQLGIPSLPQLYIYFSAL